MPRLRLMLALLMGFALALASAGASPAQAATNCVKVTDEFGSPHSQAGSDFLVKDLNVRYGSGPVKLAKSCNGTDAIRVDDGIVVEVTRPDGSTSSFSHDFSGGCSGVITPAGPFDIASHFARGDNAVKVRLRDSCGQGGSGASDIFLIHEEAPLHYRVELKAWIPKAAVVDPNVPFRAPYLALGSGVLALAVAPSRAPCFVPNPVQAPAVVSESSFGGDAHAQYDGSFRVRPVAEFDWDGQAITNFTVSPPPNSFGITSLNYAFFVAAPTPRTVRCSRTLQQTGAAGGRLLRPTSFELSMSADDPLVFPRVPGLEDSPLVPNIDSRLVGTFDSSGALTLAYDTDRFPSHGLRVTVDGVDRETRVTNDVSCLDDSSVRGLFGMGLLALALSLHDNQGTLVVNPEQPPNSSSTPSAACSQAFLTVDFVSYAAQQLAGAQAASAASTLRVAPIGADGKPGKFVKLDRAVASGLVAKQELSRSRFVLGVNPAQPVLLRSRGQMSLTTTRLTNGKPGRAAQYGPLAGRVRATLGSSSVRVTRNGKRVRSTRADKRAPKTKAKVRGRGRRVIVTFSARDRSGVQSTIVTLNGKPLKVRRQRVRVPKSRLGKLRFFSMDVFGNAEKPKRIRGRS